ncbi:MAG: DUF3515 family protein [Pseudonocardiaceae bacterium]|nr:DUF3515 family protein [Pseudonocardiaceae bacterium]
MPVTEPDQVPARDRSGIPRWLLALAVGLPIVLVVTVVVAATVLRTQGPGPLALPPVPAPEARSGGCDALLATLPEELDAGDVALDRRRITAPAPAGTAAWGQPPVVLRCGLPRPAELTATSRLIDVSGVEFLEVAGHGASSWIVVDRPVYVALTLPDGVSSGPLQQVAGGVRDSLPRREVDVGN